MRRKKIQSWIGTHVLTIEDDGHGRVDGAALAAFTHGHCHSFALAINKLTGWPIVGVGREAQGDSAYSPSHCLNYSPELRKYVDIYGARKRHEGGRKLNSNISPRPARKLDGYLKPSARAALPFAKTVLREMGVAV